MTTTNEPFFNGAELVAMAVTCSEKEYIDNDDLIHWMAKTFKTFKYLKFGWQYAICDVFRDYDVPIIEIRDGYTIDPTAARVVLRHALNAAGAGDSRFFDLPAELRNRI